MSGGSVLRAKIELIPKSPGVYMMKDKEGEIFYIGKARNLRARLRSYLAGSDDRHFVSRLDELLDDIDVILTDSEQAALNAENSLIKEHKPRYNIRLVDDKEYVSLRLDRRHPAPRLEVRRQVRDDGAAWFGPYHSARTIRHTLRLINRHFRLRTCSDATLRSRQRPCLQHQIDRCLAPCVFAPEECGYDHSVDGAVALLRGKSDELAAALEQRMLGHAALMEYEAAAVARDQLQAIRAQAARGAAGSHTDFSVRDIIGVYREGPAVEIHVMRQSGGRLIDARRHSFDEIYSDDEAVIEDFVSRYYTGGAPVPDQILLPLELSWAAPISDLLSTCRGGKVSLLSPKRGTKRRLVELASANARQAFVDKDRSSGGADEVAQGLYRLLKLQRVPRTIECCDISHIQGEDIVASVVRFWAGAPDKSGYRHYKIRTTTGQDDFRSMYEVVCRRSRRGLQDGDLPDLLVIDGGKGQLGAARAALDDHGVDSVSLIALAKARSKTSEDTVNKPERVFVSGQKQAIIPHPNSAEVYLLAQLRDEAHRFAIEFQRKLRKTRRLRSGLDDIPGVGPKRRRALLRAFGSLKGVRRASAQEIADVVGDALARAIEQHFAGETVLRQESEC